jgi:crotonobetainyl-CoA:carnitine CoA-transferase CaiB-like acyl-CoA transferase
LSSPEKFWQGLLEVVGKKEWASDPLFRDRKGRQENHEELSKRLQEVFRGGSRDDWVRQLRDKDVPCAPMNTLDEVFQDPQVREYGFPVEVEHPKMGKLRLVGSAVEMSRTPPKIKSAPPVLGEHNEEILRELGFDQETVKKLKAANVL